MTSTFVRALYGVLGMLSLVIGKPGGVKRMTGPLAVCEGAAMKQSSSASASSKQDIFAEPVIGRALRDPLAGNGGLHFCTPE